MCEETDSDERGRFHGFRDGFAKLRPFSTGKWLWFLRIYTLKQLTIHTDRLAATRGIANEIQKTRPDKYRLGIWTNDIEIQLLWVSDEDFKAEDLSGLPLWC